MEIHTPAVQRMPEELWIQLAILLRDKFPCSHGKLLEIQPAQCECRYKTGNIASLASTSQFLRQIVRPLLYHRIYIDFHNIECNIVLMESLEKAPNIHARVYHLTIQNWTRDNSRLDSCIASFLGQLCHLHHLNVRYSGISTEIVQLLLRSTHLCTLDLHFSHWTEDGASRWAAGPQLDHSEFTSLKISCSPCDEAMLYQASSSYAKFFVPTLRKIGISGPLGDDLPSRLPFGPLKNIAHLRFDFTGWNVTQLFLSRSPNVEAICIHTHEPTPSTLGTVSNLRSVAGWPDFVQAASIGRPGVAEQTWHGRTLVDVRTMAIGNNELKKLCIIQAKWSPDTFHSLGLRCPRLTWLEISGHRNAWRDLDLAAEVAGLPRLRVLLLTWQRKKRDPRPEMLTEQRTLEEIKDRHCPHLHEAQISPERAWAYMDGWVPVLRDLLRTA